MTRKAILDVIKQARLNSLMTRTDTVDLEKMETVIRHLMRERQGYLEALIEKAIENPVQKTREGLHLKAHVRCEIDDITKKRLAIAFAEEITKRGFQAADFECRIIEEQHMIGKTVILRSKILPTETPLINHQNTPTS